MAVPDETLSDGKRSKAKTEHFAPHLDLEIECERALAGPARYRLAGANEVTFGRGEKRHASIDSEVVSIKVPDRWMSSQHAALRLGEHGWQLTDLDSKNGTWKNGERVQSVALGDGDRFQLGHTLFRLWETMPVGETPFADARDLETDAPGLRTMSPSFADVVRDLRAVAASRVPVLLFGESGTGKEVVAKSVHGLSGRRNDFVAVNCAAIPQELVEAELFGHFKGAFSGAYADRLGFVRQSDGGTLFLDEIGDLPLAAQAKLLRVLQESQVMPVGGDRAIEVDLRVVSATNRQLGHMVRAGTFRHDLLARLDGVRLQLPPLRERREDLPLLISTLLQKLAADRTEVTISPDAAHLLLEYLWPLNIRELEHALQGALARSSGRPIELSDLPAALRDPADQARFEMLGPEEERHRTELIVQLGRHRGNLAAVARAMEQHRTQILRWMERYGLDPNQYRR
ncbi:MAG TPA: sigma 54-interacting transcriptional regulator [Steroidobacteraceae bacterium]|nr:sigma 54-interacting transcriptional regulator [Steroidobacteraceae bacterium]